MPRCPACFSPMTRVEDSGVKLHTCPNCFGHWIQKVALLRLCRQLATEAQGRSPDEALAAQNQIADLAAIVVESNCPKTRRCNVCSTDMLKDKIHPMIPVNMDRCPKCDALWLDVGEFSLIKKLFVELQNSTDPEVLARRDKLALAMLQWEGRTRGVQAAEDQSSALAEGVNMLSWVLRRI